MSSPWQRTETGYRSTFDPNFELLVESGRYRLVNHVRGTSQAIIAAGGLYLALDLAEAVVHGGVVGTCDRNMLKDRETPA